MDVYLSDPKVLTLPDLTIVYKLCFKTRTDLKRNKMKALIRSYLQKTLGFKHYLSLFSLYKIYSIRIDKKEKDFLQFLKLIPEKGLILDIGANIGLTCVTLARHRPEATVFAYEPIPQNLRILNRNIKKFHLKNTKVFPLALGDENKMIDMVMPMVNSAKMQGLCHVIHEHMPKRSEGIYFNVPVKTLDSLFEDSANEEPVIALKIDVEHFEWAVLEGAKNLLKRYKPLVYCELAENENRVKSFELLTSLGYTAKMVHKGQLINYDPGSGSADNFIFMPPAA